MSRAEAKKIVRNCGGDYISSSEHLYHSAPVNRNEDKGDKKEELATQERGVHRQRYDLLVIGADEMPGSSRMKIFTQEMRQAAASGTLKVYSEDEFWRLVGQGGEGQGQDLARAYTPAGLAQKLGVTVREVRSWHRDQFLEAKWTIRKLPYFAEEELVVGQKIASLLAQGCRWPFLRKKLAALAERFPEAKRPLLHFEVRLEGRKMLVAKGGKWLDLGGQLWLDMESKDTKIKGEAINLQELAGSVIGAQSSNEVQNNEVQNGEDLEADSLLETDISTEAEASTEEEGIFEGEELPSSSKVADLNDPLHLAAASSVAKYLEDESTFVPFRRDEMLNLAADFEYEENWDGAAEIYRAVLMAHGPLPEVHFQLAEILYRQGKLDGAKERYLMAIELDEEYVEARANLGCLLVELGEFELAIASFEGALRYHQHYADAHYHLAKTLDEMGQKEVAKKHWAHFLELAPDSPWRAEAKGRLKE